MLAFLAAILLIGWIFGFTVFHVSSAMIHVLLVVALMSLVMFFVRRGRA